MRAVLACLLLSAVAISADLQSDIDDVVSHLPMKDIESIGQQYVAAHPSNAARLRYVGKVTYAQCVKDFLQTKEGQKYRAYFTNRGIDIESILLHFTEKILDISRKWLEPLKEGEFVGPAITGNMMGDFKNAVHASGFFEAVQKKMKTSPEFANFAAAIKDPEYQALFYNVVNSRGLGGYGRRAEVRGFWQELWNAATAVAAVAIVFG